MSGNGLQPRNSVLMNWAKWPRDGAQSAVQETGKVASAPSPFEPSMEAIVGEITKSLGTWMTELPPNIEKVAATRDGKPSSSPTIKSIWRHPKAHPLVLDLLLLDKYGTDYLFWEPDSLLLTLKKDDIHISNSVWSKIQAIRVVHNSPSPWRRWEGFHWVSLGLDGRAPNFIYVEEPELGIMAAAMDTMNLADPDRETEEEVDKFVAAAAATEGVLYLPDPLSFAQRELDQPKIRCARCGTTDRDDNDVRCVACGHDELHKVPHEYEDVKAEVRSYFEQRKGMPLEQAVEGLPDTCAGDAAHHLLIQWDYRNQVRSNLVSQLRMLRDGTQA